MKTKIKRSLKALVSAALFALVAPAVGAETIVDARYAAPVDRYGHFALGRPHEYARLTATTNTGRKLVLQCRRKMYSRIFSRGW